ncbi:hypothetical protein RJT34_08074 [Clitoria ternatea]|uniref:EF-hand domain-containing protein n=1 Tax=Clitoria ternatea TaxID=43366 RepID=A0AAN9PSK3_CLITE
MPVIVPPAKEKNITEAQRIMKKLAEADMNKDGSYSKEEVKKALTDLGGIFPEWRTNRCFKQVDADNNGQISGTEIETLVEYLFDHGYGKK